MFIKNLWSSKFFDTVYSGRRLPSFRMNLLSTS